MCRRKKHIPQNLKGTGSCFQSIALTKKKNIWQSTGAKIENHVRKKVPKDFMGFDVEAGTHYFNKLWLLSSCVGWEFAVAGCCTSMLTSPITSSCIVALSSIVVKPYWPFASHWTWFWLNSSASADFPMCSGAFCQKKLATNLFIFFFFACSLQTSLLVISIRLAWESRESRWGRPRVSHAFNKTDQMGSAV